MGGLALLVVAIVVITAVVGAIAQFLNKLNEANAPPARAKGEAGRQSQKDMDRFLAEIDRLRRKNQEASDTSAARPVEAQPKPKPRQTAKSTRTEKPRPPIKPMAEVVDPPKRKRVDSSPLEAPPIPVLPGTLSPSKLDPATLPVASIVGAIPPGTGAPAATRVTKLPALPGSKARSKLDTNLATLLASGHGMVLGVILQEVLGPPKCRKQ